MNNRVETRPDEIGIASLQVLLGKADEALEQGNYEEAEVLSNQIRASSPRSESVLESPSDWIKLQAGVLRILGAVAIQRNDYADAREQYANAKSLSMEVQDQSGIASATLGLGNVHVYQSEYRDAVQYFEEALAMFEQLGELSGVASNLANAATAYQNLSEYQRALEYYDKALEIHMQQGNKNRIASILGNTGIVYEKLSDYSRSLECYQRALDLNQELQNNRGVATNLSNIGLIYRYLSNHTLALEYLLRARVLYEETGDTKGLALNVGNCGLVYKNLGDYPRAMECFYTSLALCQETGYKQGVAYNYGYIGGIFQIQEDYSNALAFMLKALSVSTELDLRFNIAVALSNLGDLYAEAKFEGYDLAKAEEYQLKALEISEAIDSKFLMYSVHDALASVYRSGKRWEEADAHYQKYHKLYVEVQGEEAQRQAAAVEQRRLSTEREKTVAIEKARADAEMNATVTLLHKVLPSSIAGRLMNGETIADYFPSISILFADIVGFTPIAAQMQARDVLSLLNYVFGEFDRIMGKHGCQKIKTMGDGYMAVCGAPIPCDDHVERLANAAFDLLGDIDLPESLRSSLPKGSVFHLRIGLHCGPAFAGIVGEKGFVYDVYSDAVNLASRMESHGEPGRIHCSEQFKELLQSTTLPLRFAERGQIDIKGKGMMRTYFLERP